MDWKIAYVVMLHACNPAFGRMGVDREVYRSYDRCDAQRWIINEFTNLQIGEYYIREVLTTDWMHDEIVHQQFEKWDEKKD